jgi:hypothetical protein
MCKSMTKPCGCVHKYTFQYLKINLSKESCHRGVGSVEYVSCGSVPAVQSKNNYAHDLVSYNLMFILVLFGGIGKSQIISLFFRVYNCYSTGSHVMIFSEKSK